MAERSSNDVVNQTRSGGDLSPSDVPASKPDNLTAGGDRGDVQASDNNSKPKANTHSSQEISTGNPSSTETNGVGSESNDANTSLSPNVGDGVEDRIQMRVDRTHDLTLMGHNTLEQVL